MQTALSWVAAADVEKPENAKSKERKVCYGEALQMSYFEITMAVINIAAVVMAPIFAVIIGQILQDRAQNRKDKMDIFKTLMVNRIGWSVASVQAMNIIDVVYSNDKKVRNCWKDYYEKLCIQNPDEMQQKQIQMAHYKLLESMAVSLGYKDKITWETIQNPYIPIGMQNAMQQQQTIQTGQEILAASMEAMISRLMGGAVSGAQTQTEDEQEALTHAQQT